MEVIKISAIMAKIKVKIEGYWRRNPKGKHPKQYTWVESHIKWVQQKERKKRK